MHTVIEAAIRNEVAHLVKTGETFSAYDITKRVRTDFVRFPHEECRNIVHEMFDTGQMGHYDRRLHDYDGKTAWQYFPNPTHANRIPSNVRRYDSEVYSPQFWTVTPDARGRICIPADAMRAIGCETGDVAFVWMEPNKERILVKAQVGHLLDESPEFLKGYVVDTSNNIRISPSTLTAANLTITEFNVTVNNDEIVVSGL